MHMLQLNITKSCGVTLADGSTGHPIQIDLPRQATWHFMHARHVVASNRQVEFDGLTFRWLDYWGRGQSAQQKDYDAQLDPIGVNLTDREAFPDTKLRLMRLSTTGSFDRDKMNLLFRMPKTQGRQEMVLIDDEEKVFFRTGQQYWKDGSFERHSLLYQAVDLDLKPLEELIKTEGIPSNRLPDRLSSVDLESVDFTTNSDGTVAADIDLKAHLKRRGALNISLKFDIRLVSRYENGRLIRVELENFKLRGVAIRLLNVLSFGYVRRRLEETVKEGIQNEIDDVLESYAGLFKDDAGAPLGISGAPISFVQAMKGENGALRLVVSYVVTFREKHAIPQIDFLALITQLRTPQ